MSYRRTITERAAGAALALLLGLSGGTAHAHGTDGPTLDIHQYARDAELIFKGRIVDIRYAKSESVPVLDPFGAPLLDEEGQPVLQDGSATPHTFVTYRVGKVFKGSSAAGRTITLRFFGGLDDQLHDGVDEDGNRYTGAPVLLRSSIQPLFDIGDQDILFVERNGSDECPLVACKKGRFRLAKRGRENGGGTGVYTEEGFEVVRIESDPYSPDWTDEAGWGRLRPRPEMLSHTAAPGLTLDLEIVDQPSDGDPDPENTLGPQFTRGKFVRYLKDVVRQMHTADELAALRPVPSADPSEPFTAQPLADTVMAPAPDEVDVPPARPWIDRLPPEERDAILEAERLEAEAVLANGGDPVIP